MLSFRIEEPLFSPLNLHFISYTDNYNRLMRTHFCLASQSKEFLLVLDLTQCLQMASECADIIPNFTLKCFCMANNSQ